MSFKSKIKEAERLIEDLIKKEINKKGLVDTGALLDSIDVTIKETSKGLSIQVEAEDYYTFLDEEHNITEDALASSGFNKVEEKLGDAYVDLIEEKIKK